MNVVGLDLSLTATGVATEAAVEVLVTADLRGCERLTYIRDQVMLAVGNAYTLEREPARADLVVIEGFSYGSKGSSVYEIGGLGWIIRLDLWNAGIPWVEVPPSTLKKYATGHGNAGKGEVLAAAIRRLDYEGHDDNEADALWLRAMALDWYGAGTPVPQAHREALLKVDWPSLGRAAA